MTRTGALFCCDQAIVPADLAGQQRWLRQDLRSYGTRTPELNLRAQSLAGASLQTVNDRAADLVRVASYVYAADQMIFRGGPPDVYGKNWQRDLALCIPVTEPDVWMWHDVRQRLEEALAFLTDDSWTFRFCSAPPELQQIPLDLADTSILNNPDAVVLFSGGADSLAVAVETAATESGRPVIVSHRPAPNIDARQRQLVDHLRQRFPPWRFPHLSFAIHRRGGDAMDTSQRSRAFLYASLGTAATTSPKRLRRRPTPSCARSSTLDPSGSSRYPGSRLLLPGELPRQHGPRVAFARMEPLDGTQKRLRE
jgi:hypothetical protein